MTPERDAATARFSDFYAKATAPVVALARSQAELMAGVMESHWLLWSATQSAALSAATAWAGAARGADAGAVSPCLDSAAADLADCSDAVMQAQIDALDATRRTLDAGRAAPV